MQCVSITRVISALEWKWWRAIIIPIMHSLAFNLLSFYFLSFLFFFFFFIVGRMALVTTKHIVQLVVSEAEPRSGSQLVWSRRYHLDYYLYA